LKKKIDELQAEPGKIFGLLYPYFLIVVFIAVGIYYVTHLGSIARHSVPPVPPDTTQVQTDLPVVEPRTVPPVDIVEVSQPTDDMISQG
jgi:hypothetical protein